MPSDAFVHFYCLPNLQSVEFSGYYADATEFRALSAALPPRCHIIVTGDIDLITEYVGGRSNKDEDGEKYAPGVAP